MSVTDNTSPEPLRPLDLGPGVPAAEPAVAEAPPAAYNAPPSVFIREIIETLLLTFFIFWLVNSVVGRYRIDGNSMNPTLLNGEYLIISNFAYRLDDPDRGDIIVFRHPQSELNLIKRVIGVPGDTILIENGVVSVNGTVLDEPYIQAPPTYNSSWVVPEGQYFVLGDNRNNSSDSHAWGFLPADHILGKAEFVYWPPRDWAKVPHFDHESPAG
jgi:signal peptidase I